MIVEAESKFEVGDWVTLGKGLVTQIGEVKFDGKTFHYGVRKHFNSDERYWIEEYALDLAIVHLIEEPKDNL